MLGFAARWPCNAVSLFVCAIPLPPTIMSRVRLTPRPYLRRNRGLPRTHLDRQGHLRGEKPLADSDLEHGDAHSRTVVDFPKGGYRFIPGGFQFSGGVAAAAAFEIKPSRFRPPMPLINGFCRIEAIITAAARPPPAFCACELRPPRQLTAQG